MTLVELSIGATLGLNNFVSIMINEIYHLVDSSKASRSEFADLQ